MQGLEINTWPKAAMAIGTAIAVEHHPADAFGQGSTAVRVSNLIFRPKPHGLACAGAGIISASLGLYLLTLSAFYQVEAAKNGCQTPEPCPAPLKQQDQDPPATQDSATESKAKELPPTGSRKALPTDEPDR